MGHRVCMCTEAWNDLRLPKAQHAPIHLNQMQDVLHPAPPDLPRSPVNWDEGLRTRLHRKRSPTSDLWATFSFFLPLGPDPCGILCGTSCKASTKPWCISLAATYTHVLSPRRHSCTHQTLFKPLAQLQLIKPYKTRQKAWQPSFRESPKGSDSLEPTALEIAHSVKSAGLGVGGRLWKPKPEASEVLKPPQECLEYLEMVSLEP